MKKLTILLLLISMSSFAAGRINSIRKDTNAALLSALECGNLDIVSLLLENGADIEAKDKTGKTPLLIATGHGDEAIVALLLNKKADIEAKDHDRKTALVIATSNGNAQIVALLLDRYAQIKAVNNDSPVAVTEDSLPEMSLPKEPTTKKFDQTLLPEEEKNFEKNTSSQNSTTTILETIILEDISEGDDEDDFDSEIIEMIPLAETAYETATQPIETTTQQTETATQQVEAAAQQPADSIKHVETTIKLPEITTQQPESITTQSPTLETINSQVTPLENPLKEKPLTPVPIKPGIYRHYKGSLYKVLGTSPDDESGPLVIYQLLFENPDTGKNALCIKPQRQFCADVMDNDKALPCFTFVGSYETVTPPNNTITTETGLSYEILKEAPANAQSPKSGNNLVVHYTGWLESKGKPGKKIDSSIDRDYPFSFTIGTNYVIAGWDEGLLTMKIGEKRRLTIPPNLGYGNKGVGDIVPPQATLIYDVELLEII